MTAKLDTPGRTRTITWDDPLAGPRAGRRLSGLEYLEAMGRGELPRPPFGTLLGMEFVEVAPGRAVFALQPAEYHYNPIGVVHGGVASTLLDSAMGCALQSTLPAETGYVTLELKVNFLRALTRDTGRVICEGEVIHVGGRVATAQARLVDEQGTLCAHATSTLMVFRPDERKAAA